MKNSNKIIKGFMTTEAAKFKTGEHKEIHNFLFFLSFIDKYLLCVLCGFTFPIKNYLPASIAAGVLPSLRNDSFDNPLLQPVASVWLLW